MARHTNGSGGNPHVFNVERNEDGLWLNDNWAKPDNRWNPENSFVFRFRNSLHFSPACTAGEFYLPRLGRPSRCGIESRRPRRWVIMTLCTWYLILELHS